MIVGSALIAFGALWFLDRASLPVPAFTPPTTGLPSFGTQTLQLALMVTGAAFALFAVVRMLRRRRAAA